MSVKNDEMIALLNCTKADLRRLKDACKEHMKKTSIPAGGKPMLGQLLSEVDPTEYHRNRMWKAVANSNDRLKNMLQGRLWTNIGRNRPRNFQTRLAKVKAKIVKDHNSTERRQPQGRSVDKTLSDFNPAKRRRPRRRSVDNVDATSSEAKTDDSEAPTPSTGKRLKVRETTSHVNHQTVSPVTLSGDDLNTRDALVRARARFAELYSARGKSLKWPTHQQSEDDDDEEPLIKRRKRLVATERTEPSSTPSVPDQESTHPLRRATEPSDRPGDTSIRGDLGTQASRQVGPLHKQLSTGKYCLLESLLATNNTQLSTLCDSSDNNSGPLEVPARPKFDIHPESSAKPYAQAGNQLPIGKSFQNGRSDANLFTTEESTNILGRPLSSSTVTPNFSNNINDYDDDNDNDRGSETSNQPSDDRTIPAAPGKRVMLESVSSMMEKLIRVAKAETASEFKHQLGQMLRRIRKTEYEGSTPEEVQVQIVDDIEREFGIGSGKQRMP